METTVMLGKLIGPAMFVVGIGLLFNTKFILEVMKSFSKEKALIFVTWIITFVVWLAIVLNSNNWELSWRVIPTIIGWGALIKWASFIILPEVVMNMSSSMMKCTKLFSIVAIVYAALWAWVSYNVFM